MFSKSSLANPKLEVVNRFVTFMKLSTYEVKKTLKTLQNHLIRIFLRYADLNFVKQELCNHDVPNQAQVEIVEKV